MQIFWVSGPVGKIHSINVSFRMVIISIASMILLLISFGSLLNYLGFRVALDYDPEIARKFGNLRTALEVENLQTVYRNRLRDIENDQQIMINKLKELQSQNEKLTSLFPQTVVSALPNRKSQGGSYLKQRSRSNSDVGTVINDFENSLADSRVINFALSQEIGYMDRLLAILSKMPLGIPVTNRSSQLSSLFGNRIDPLIKRPAFHSGIDFELPIASNVVATGDGIVVQSERHPEYGNVISIKHHGGFVSRYAHNSQIFVNSGDVVSKGQLIAKSGNSGRSTGPHLHYEIVLNNQAINPRPFLLDRHAASVHDN